MLPIPVAFAWKEPDIPLKMSPNADLMHRIFYLYSFVLPIRSLLTEWIAVFIEQLHQRPILGLQAPLLGTELYKKTCQPSWSFPRRRKSTKDQCSFYCSAKENPELLTKLIRSGRILRNLILP